MRDDLLSEAEALYQTFGLSRPFYDVLYDHLENGIVHSTEDYFMLGSSFYLDDDFLKQKVPWLLASKPKKECLFVYLFLGDIDKALEVIPSFYEEIAFYRHKQSKLRFYNINRLKKILSYGRNIWRRNTKHTAATKSAAAGKRKGI